MSVENFIRALPYTEEVAVVPFQDKVSVYVMRDTGTKVFTLPKTISSGVDKTIARFTVNEILNFLKESK